MTPDAQAFLTFLDYMEKEKGIDRKTTLAAIENALLTASRKAIGPAKDLRLDFNPTNGEIKAFAKLRVVEKVNNPFEEISLLHARKYDIKAHLGSLVEAEVTPKDFGRIAAQVFRQTMNQNFRSIEKTMVVDEFKDRVGEIVSGTIRRFERSDVIIEIGRYEAIMPDRERVRTEDYTPGERLRALILNVDNNHPRGPKIILSRSHPDFVRKLFELEVNEIHDGTVVIRALAREAGHRTKLAVASTDDKIDPVGACVGLRGSRVKNIVRELNNEKIDLFRWSEDVRELVIEALKPAKLKKIEMDEPNKHVVVSVDEENLSLAIGKRGQNVRLTAQITGWKIDIQKDEVVVLGFEDKLKLAVDKMALTLGITAEQAESIVKAGFGSMEGLASAEVEDLKEALPDFDPGLLTQIHEKSRSPINP